MKKKINLFVTLLVIVGIFCGVSCKNEVLGFYMDTVLTLDRTNVNAIAYPGMNYISWTPVANASGYILYIHENGNCISTRSFNYAHALPYFDIIIRGVVEYTDYVDLAGASSSAGSVVFKIKQDSVDLVKHTFFILMLYTHLISISLSNRTIFISPLIPYVRI